MSQTSKMVRSTLDWLQMLRELPKEHVGTKRRAKIWNAIMTLDNGLEDLPAKDYLEIRSALRDYFHQYMTPREEHEVESYYEGHILGRKGG